MWTVAEEPSGENLQLAIEALQKKISLLKKENELFSSHLKRQPQAVPGDAATFFPQGKVHKPLRNLSFDAKCDIARSEIDSIKEDIERQRSAWDREVDNTKAEIDEHLAEKADTKRDIYEFKRDLIGWDDSNPLPVTVDKFVAFFEAKINSLQKAGIEKMQFKNQGLQTAIHRVQNLIQAKMAKGEDVKKIDFEQLEIENKQYLKKMKDKNLQLVKLKVSTTRTVSYLNKKKEKLNRAISEKEKLTQTLHAKTMNLQKMKRDLEQINDERDQCLRVNYQLKDHKEESKMPQVMEYIQEKAAVAELQRKLRTWERAVEIATQASKMATKSKSVRSAASASATATSATGKLSSPSSAKSSVRRGTTVKHSAKDPPLSV